MSERNFTKGPWVARECDYKCSALGETFALVLEISDNDSVIALLPRYGHKTQSNGRLITAAPDLYAALKDCLASGEDADYNKVRAVLARVKGITK